MTRCDNCKKQIQNSTNWQLRKPCGECEHCNSELYEEYDFCSKDCLTEYMIKTFQDEE